MRKYQVELQDEEKACGAYCILMILKYYGFNEEIKEIKKKARLNQNGISIKGMIECLKAYQIEALAYHCSLDDLKNEGKLPCILYMIYEGVGHFVVLFEIANEEYIVGDPARGLITLYPEEMQEHYANCLIMIKHVGRVPQLSYQSYSSFLKDTFKSYQKHMISLILKGVWISLLGCISSYFFQIVIDDIAQQTHVFYMIILSVSYGLIEIIKTKLENQKNKESIHLQRALDEDYVFTSSMNMLKQSYSFFYQDKGAIQSQLLSLFDLSEMSLAFFERLFLDGLSFIVFLLGMVFLNIQMTLLVIVMLVIVAWVSYRYLSALQKVNQIYLEAHFIYQHHVLELIENQFLIKRFCLHQKERERSYHIYLDEALLKEKQALGFNQLQIHIQYIIYIFYTFILILGFYSFHYQHMTIGQLMMFYMLVSYCIQPVLNMVTMLAQYKQVSLIFEKYKAFLLEKEVEKQWIEQPITSIVLDNVSYAYGYQLPIIEHLDLTIDHHLLIKGKTGSGKSTLLRLLLGVDLDYGGDIYINGIELRNIQLESLYQHLGYVNETPTFLHMSLFDNFLCEDEKKVKKYLRAFGMKDLIEMFYLVLSEDGSPLSLGQRQVVALVRLLCQTYDVLILDEAFSHMDSTLANKIMKYLLKNDEGKIYIMVNHQTKLVNKNVGCVIMGKER